MKNTFKNNGILLWIVIFLCSVIMWSCSQQWDDYKKYTKDGEIEYTGKFDTAIVYPGKERVRITGILMPDPKIVKCKIFWNNKADSIEYDINQEANKNVFDQTFSVDEGVKSFSIYTYDALGNSSVPVNAIGASYGRRYRNKLSTRRIISIDYYVEKVIINWDNIDKSIGPVKTEVKYTTLSGNDTTVITPTTEAITILKNFKNQTENFTFRTVFKPEINSIDTFCTAYNTRIAPQSSDLELYRAEFKAFPLPGDSPTNGGAGGVAAMWDGKPNGYANSSFTTVATGSNQIDPSIVTFDIGRLTRLSKVWILPFKDPNWYSFTTMKRFEIWGSANPNPDGSLDASWLLLGSYIVNRPSGLAWDKADTPADIAAASGGFTWPVDTNAPKVRYLRIRCLESFRPGYTAQSIGEIKVYEPTPQ